MNSQDSSDPQSSRRFNHSHCFLAVLLLMCACSCRSSGAEPVKLVDYQSAEAGFRDYLRTPFGVIGNISVHATSTGRDALMVGAVNYEGEDDLDLKGVAIREVSVSCEGGGAVKLVGDTLLVQHAGKFIAGDWVRHRLGEGRARGVVLAMQCADGVRFGVFDAGGWSELGVPVPNLVEDRQVSACGGWIDLEGVLILFLETDTGPGTESELMVLHDGRWGIIGEAHSSEDGVTLFSSGVRVMSSPRGSCMIGLLRPVDSALGESEVFCWNAIDGFTVVDYVQGDNGDSELLAKRIFPFSDNSGTGVDRFVVLGENTPRDPVSHTTHFRKGAVQVRFGVIGGGGPSELEVLDSGTIQLWKSPKYDSWGVGSVPAVVLSQSESGQYNSMVVVHDAFENHIVLGFEGEMVEERASSFTKVLSESCVLLRTDSGRYMYLSPNRFALPTGVTPQEELFTIVSTNESGHDVEVHALGLVESFGVSAAVIAGHPCR